MTTSPHVWRRRFALVPNPAVTFMTLAGLLSLPSASPQSLLNVTVTDVLGREIWMPLAVYQDGLRVAEGEEAVELAPGDYVVRLPTGAAQRFQIHSDEELDLTLPEPSVHAVAVGGEELVLPVPDGRRRLAPWSADLFPWWELSAVDQANLLGRRSMREYFPEVSPEGRAGLGPLLAAARGVVAEATDWGERRWALFAAVVWVSRLGEDSEVQSLVDRLTAASADAIYWRPVLEALLQRDSLWVEARIGRLLDAGPGARLALALGLLRHGVPAWSTVRAAVEGATDPVERTLAIQLLDGCEQEEAGPALAELASWRTQLLPRLHLAAALARRGDLESLRLLVDTVEKEKNEAVRALAADLLVQITPRPAELVEAMIRSENPWMEVVGTRALEDLPGVQARGALKEAVSRSTTMTPMLVMANRLTGYGEMTGVRRLEVQGVQRSRPPYRGMAALQLAAHGYTLRLEEAIDHLTGQARNAGASDLELYRLAVQLGGAFHSPQAEHADPARQALEGWLDTDRAALRLGAQVGWHMQHFEPPEAVRHRANFFLREGSSFLAVSFSLRAFGRPAGRFRYG